MLSLGLGKSQYRPTFRALAIDVRLAVTETVAHKLEKSAEFFIFPSALGNILGKHSEKDQNDQK